MADGLLNVAAVRLRTRSNGPGLRSAVWVQGCSLRCPGCFNPTTHPHQPNRFWEPEVLAERMMVPEIEGISILGGEPFEQTAACARLAEAARGLGASVVTYSGYTWAYLQRCRLPEVQALLASTDLLIAGPFIQGQMTDGRGWHGSSNQEFIYLTDRYDEYVLERLDEVPVLEVRADGVSADWTGIPLDDALLPPLGGGLPSGQGGRHTVYDS
jgi:anaerobic ribonucleoside-triphosphate reductase activating protein